MALFLGTAATADSFDMESTSLGDSEILTLGGYLFAPPVVLNLAPTNALPCQVSCQIVYRDDLVPYATEDTVEYIRLMSKRMNEWLADFVAAEYAGLRVGELVDFYLGRKDVPLARDLQRRFPLYVKERLAEFPEGERPDVRAVTVTVRAVGLFRSMLRLRARAKSE